MLPIIGILIVFGAIVAGYVMEHGKLLVLAQPAELIIIFGAAAGTVITANPLPTLIRLGKAMAAVLASSPYTKAFYTENIKMLYDLFSMARKAGTAKLEEDIDNPAKSDILKKYPKFLKSHQACDFLCDTLRMAVSGVVDPMDIDAMMEVDLESHHREAHEPVAALSSMADSLPGLGIVAAVLGVVITMGALGGSKEEIGQKVAAALVGTFLGILLCYGVFGPIAAAMGKRNDDEGAYFGFLRMAALAFVKGLSPMMSVELSRRTIPHSVRPNFKEMEAVCRGGGAKAASAPAAAAKAA
jgi:chemotaxis protein MotA